jgi:alanyl-tRNA synthetase
LTEGELRAGQRLTARVDAARRQAIRRAHSATHILHHALQKRLGAHAQQQGSKVDEDWLRFDFANLAPVPPDELAAIEDEVNATVAARAPIRSTYVSLAEARDCGAMMLFGEKYPDPVRLVSMGDFSKELCGGTHLGNTAEVEAFEIVAEEGVAAGTRRITALTGEKAKQHAQQTRAALNETAQLLDVDPLEAPAAVRQLATRVRQLRKHLAPAGKAADRETQPQRDPAAVAATYWQIRSALRDAARTLNVSLFDAPTRVMALLQELDHLEKRQAALAESGQLSADFLLKTAERIAGAVVVVREMPGANPAVMRRLIDQLRKKAGSAAAMLATRHEGQKALLVAGVSQDLANRGVSARDWVSHVAPLVGGGGGGRAEMAEAGGKHPEKLDLALDAARAKIAEMLGD